MKLKIHYYTSGGNVLCNEIGTVSCQTVNPKKVTCKRCKKSMGKGIQTKLEIK